MSARQTTVLCLASYVKGQEFLRECKRLGCRVLLLTVEKHKDADWPRESLDERFLMPDLLRREDVIHAVSYLARKHDIHHTSMRGGNFASITPVCDILFGTAE